MRALGRGVVRTPCAHSRRPPARLLNKWRPPPRHPPTHPPTLLIQPRAEVEGVVGEEAFVVQSVGQQLGHGLAAHGAAVVELQPREGGGRAGEAGEAGFEGAQGDRERDATGGAGGGGPAWRGTHGVGGGGSSSGTSSSTAAAGPSFAPPHTW